MSLKSLGLIWGSGKPVTCIHSYYPNRSWKVSLLSRDIQSHSVTPQSYRGITVTCIHSYYPNRSWKVSLLSRDIQSHSITPQSYRGITVRNRCQFCLITKKRLCWRIQRVGYFTKQLCWRTQRPGYLTRRTKRRCKEDRAWHQGQQVSGTLHRVIKRTFWCRWQCSLT